VKVWRKGCCHLLFWGVMFGFRWVRCFLSSVGVVMCCGWSGKLQRPPQIPFVGLWVSRIWFCGLVRMSRVVCLVGLVLGGFFSG